MRRWLRRGTETAFLNRVVMEEKLVTYMLERGGKVFVVEYVPARVSKDTGEAFFSPETVDRLQAIIAGKSVPVRHIEAPVYEFAA